MNTRKNDNLGLVEKKSNADETSKCNSFIVFTIHIPRELTPNLDFESSFNYLSDGQLIRINTSELPRLIESGQITTKKQNVRSLNFEPDLWTHGFECRYLPDNIQDLISIFKNGNAEEQKVIRNNIRSSLEVLVSKHYGLPVVAFDTVYRNTANDNTSVFKSVPLVHIDFPNTGLQKTLDVFREQWKPRVDNQFKNDRYRAEDIEFMINVWMPLDTIIASPLALCSNEKIDPSRLHEYDAVRRDNSLFKAVSLTPPEKRDDPWFYKPGMKGQCYLFLSTKGIHSAAKFPGENGTRESIEVRLGVFKRNK